MEKIYCIFILFTLLMTSCKKKELSPEPKSYTSKMQGMRFWHGQHFYYNYSYGGPARDTVINVVDTFGFVLVNDSTICEQTSVLYGFDTMRYYKYDSANTLIFKGYIQASGYLFAEAAFTVYYNYANNTFVYTNDLQDKYGYNGYIELHSP